MKVNQVIPWLVISITTCMATNTTSPAKERTLIMIKPEGVQRGLVGKIIQRFEEKGFKLVALKFVNASEKIMMTKYAARMDMKNFNKIIQHMVAGPVIPMVWEGPGVVKVGQSMLSATNPAESEPGDLSVQAAHNIIISGSDSVEMANKEIGLWFKPEELLDYNHHSKRIYEERKKRATPNSLK